MMHELQLWHKSMVEVKARTMYFSHSISFTDNVQFRRRIPLEQTFILSQFLLHRDRFLPIVLSCSLCAHIVGEPGNWLLK